MAVEFGKYRLLKKLGSGGMGEVFLASPRGDDDRKVVIKRILPHLTENTRFLRLFLDEARIAATLNHPNIVRILELDEVDGAWFVGMEYLAGRDLREVGKLLRGIKRPVPVNITCKIAMEVASGLYFAHRASDPSGKPLRIVHRDVSPHNILVGFDGRVKLIDFGVAKAANKASHTRTGLLKGKFPYMAPEQAQGSRVDFRADLFALGIVMWEALAGRYLFRAKSDAATLRNVRACRVPPPSQFNPAVPARLDRIVLRLLEKAPRDRFLDAAALREALSDFVVERQLSAGPEEISAFMRELFPEGEDDRLLELGEDEELTSSLDERSSPVRNRSATERLELPALGAEGAVDEGEAEKPASARPTRLADIPGQRATNLWPQPTSFVGRVVELAELHQRLRSGTRLLTLTGAGGTGKTRLAIQLASQLVGLFSRRGGVWLCDLTRAADVDGLCLGVARALEVPLVTGTTPEDMVSQLGHAIAAHGDVLLVIDNFEQVASFARETLSRWYEAAPRARFLVTSRQVLGIPEETVFDVPPLKLPDPDADYETSEAVELFLERVQTARPGFAPSEGDRKAVNEIVRHLDGLPLAIELAAARMSVLNPRQLLQRLPRRFELLADHSGAPSDGRQTLLGTIDWSWSLLQPWEQATLAQCALFRGGFTPEAAEAVVDLSPWPEAPEVLDVLTALRAKSLIRTYHPPGSAGETRYGLYESIREYARAKLRGSPEEQRAIERHARYFTALGSRLAEGAEGSAPLLDALALEAENLFAVFQRARRALPSERALRSKALPAALSMDPLLLLRGPFGIHLQMLDQALAASEDVEPLRLALGYEARGRARQARGRLNEAFEDYERVRTIAHEKQAPGLEGRAESYLATVERLLGRIPEAKARYARALELLRRVRDRRTEGRTLGQLGALLQEQGMFRDALSHYVLALEIHREVGDRRFEGINLSNLGVLQQQQGLLGDAKANYESALAIHRELGNRRSEGIATLNLGDLHRDLNSPGQAAALYERALAIHREVGNRRFEGIALACLGTLTQEQGELDEAGNYLRHALAVLREVGDRRYASLVKGALAACDALSGREGEAEEALVEAERTLAKLGDRPFLDAVEVYHAHLELASMERAIEEGRDLDADRHERAIQERIRRAESPTRAPEKTISSASPAQRSEQVRAALRSLRMAMRHLPGRR